MLTALVAVLVLLDLCGDDTNAAAVRVALPVVVTVAMCEWLQLHTLVVALWLLYGLLLTFSLAVFVKQQCT